MRAITATLTIRRLVALVAVVALTAVLATGAAAFWSVGDSHGNAAAVATTLEQGPAPTADSHGDHVHVTWGVATATNGRPADGYIINRYDRDTLAKQTTLPGCAGVVTANTCIEQGVPEGHWTYTVTPVMGTYWRGAESNRSGAAMTGPMNLSLDRSVFGPPFPATTTATLTGFTPSENISYLLDGVSISGSPSSVGADGKATIASIAIPAGLADGPHTVRIVGDHPGTPSHALASILIDTTAPSINGFVTPAPNAAGWNNTSPVELNGAVGDGSGSGIAMVFYTDDGSDPKTSSTVKPALAPPMASATATYKYYGVDLAGNESSVYTLVVKIDTTLPFPAVALIDVQGGAWIDEISHVTYYRGADAGSFSFEASVTDPGAGASGAASAANSALNGSDIGFSGVAETITTPQGGPYILNPISWVAGTTSNPMGAITFADLAGNTRVESGQILNDSAAPAGGSVDATGLGGAGGRYSTSTTLHLTIAKGTDSGSGLANGSAATDVPAQLTRASAPLTTSDGVANGTCGAYGNYAQVGGDDPPFTATDAVPADAACYRYRYLVADHVGNVATYESADIKVQTETSATLRPTDASLSAVSGVGAQSIAGSTVFYNPQRSGSFNVDAAASSPYSGIARMTFPAIAGFTGDGEVTSPLAGSTFRATYAWSGNAASPSPGTQSLSATNNAGETATNTSAFTVVRDADGPTGGSVGASGLGGSGGRYATSTTLTITLAAGTDAGAGPASSGAQLRRASAELASNGAGNGACETFGPYTQVGSDDPPSPYSDTVPSDHTCYRYELVAPDRVGNESTYTSPDIKVDAAAPPAPTLRFSALSNASWSGTGTAVYYRPGASAGGFTVTAASADMVSGIAAFAFPSLGAGWSSLSGGLGVRTYGWSAQNPTAPAGNQTVTATNNAGRSSTADFTSTPDAGAPAGGSVTYTNGAISTTTTSISFATGTDTGSGVDAASGVLQRASATLSGTTCGTFGTFATVASNPTSPFSDTVAAGKCYQYRYQVSDNVANQATFASASVVKVGVLTHALSLSNAAGAYLGNSTLYYNSNASGSFKLVDALTGGSGPASVTYPTLGLSGWTHATQTVSTPAGGPYTSSTFSWVAHPSGASAYVVSGNDTLGATSTATITFVSDQAPPSAGSISYPDATVTTASVALTTVDGTDALSGVDPASGIVKRDSTTLNTATGVCATFPGVFASTVARVGGADTSVANGYCYQYRYLVSDKVGNQVTYTSGSIVKVDLTPKVTAIASFESGGAAGDGRLESDDKLVLTFSRDLAAASVPASFTGATESRTGSANVLLTIPGITNGARDTGTSGYLAGSGSRTATFAGTALLSNSGANTTITVTVTTLTGTTTAAGQGALSFQAAPAITSTGGVGATGTFTTPSNFRLF